jgi:hypothetical protein
LTAESLAEIDDELADQRQRDAELERLGPAAPA